MPQGRDITDMEGILQDLLIPWIHREKAGKTHWILFLKQK